MVAKKKTTKRGRKTATKRSSGKRKTPARKKTTKKAAPKVATRKPREMVIPLEEFRSEEHTSELQSQSTIRMPSSA